MEWMLSYLNIQIHLSGSTARVKWYRKETSQNIILHAKSAHPIVMKRAVIRNIFRTVTEICTDDEELLESRDLAKEIVKKNGYPPPQRSSYVKGQLLSLETHVEIKSRFAFLLSLIMLVPR